MTAEDRLKDLLVGLAPEYRGCPCGTGGHYFGEGAGARTRHANWHLSWDRGAPIPSSVWWPGPLGVVTARSSRPEHQLAYTLGRLFQREKGYDFPMVAHPTVRRGDSETDLLVRRGDRAVAILISRLTSRYGVWDWSPARIPIDIAPEVPVAEIAGIWVAHGYRRLGIGRVLVEALAEREGVAPWEIPWGLPFSDDGRALAFAVCADRAVRVC